MFIFSLEVEVFGIGPRSNRRMQLVLGSCSTYIVVSPLTFLCIINTDNHLP